MNFDLSPEQTDVRDLCQKVGLERFRPTAFTHKDGKPPEENLRLLGELGLLGISLPTAYGGGGRPELEAIIAIEALAHACPATAEHALMAITGPGSFISKWGTDNQKQRFLPGLCKGTERFSISLTEPEAGTALTDLRTHAEVRADKCVINGQKIFCSHVADATHVLVFVRFGPGTDGIGAVIVGPDTPGMTIGKEHLHFSGSRWNELYFDDATIPVEDVLFDGHAFRKLILAYSLERTGAAAFCLGVAQLALDLAIEYSENRRQFGRKLSDFQFVQGKLADMYIALESARLLVYRAIARAGDGLPSRLDSSAAKVAATEAASMVTDLAMQIHGGAGMDQELPLEWLYRVVRTYTVAGGTSDIHRSMVASELVGRKLDQRLPDGREAVSA